MKRLSKLCVKLSFSGEKIIYPSDRDVAQIKFFRFLSTKIRSSLSVTPYFCSHTIYHHSLEHYPCLQNIHQNTL